MNRWLNLLGLLLVLIINYLAEKLPIGGKTTGEISAQYPVLITPAGYTFSIWSVIYILLIGFVIYGFTQQGRESKLVSSIGIYFFLSCLFNVSWLLAFHYELLISSVFIMFSLLLTLIIMYLKINDNSLKQTKGRERWLVQLPFSIYLGWICIASIVNTAVALYAANWNRFGLSDITWTIIMLIVATLIALAVGIRYNDAAIILVFVWAYIGIAMKQLPSAPLVSYAAFFFVLLLMGVLIFYKLMKSRV